MIEPKEIQRSKRKSIALIIDKDGELLVKAPYFVSEKKIFDLLKKEYGFLNSVITKTI
jgi:predicted metal-dependent hydrolase